ncbi:MAG: helix-turn-helix transcriptional regulator [Pseudomonadota bacterium]
MKRTVDTRLIKTLRTERAWSQEELAIAAGVSTRTVQRIESDGAGSTNSIKAIASALEVNLHNLETESRTQLIGIRWGVGGIVVGVSCAIMAVLSHYVGGGGSSYEAGVSLGVIGVIAGLSSAFIGWASNRT